MDEVDNYNGHTHGLGPGGTGPGNYGKLVNDDGDDDGVAKAKEILNAGNAKLIVPDAWIGDQNQWTGGANHKDGITNALTQVSSAQPGQVASKATLARNAIQGAMSGLKTGASDTEADEARKILDKAKNKLEGIGTRTSPDKAFPHGPRNWKPNSKSDEGNRWHWHLIGSISGIPYMICKSSSSWNP